MPQHDTTMEAAALSVPKAGSYLGVSADTIRRLIRSGALPHVRIGYSLRLRRADLDEFLASQMTTDWQPIAGRGRKAVK